MKTKNELETMLPDFVFGRLSEEEKRDFEESVIEYPDLLKEIQDVRVVFNRVEKMDFNKIVDDRTRNLTVKVNNKLSERSRQSGFSYLFKFALPMAIVFAGIMIFYQNSSQKSNNISSGNGFSSKLNTSLNDNYFAEIEVEDSDYYDVLISENNSFKNSIFDDDDLQLIISDNNDINYDNNGLIHANNTASLDYLLEKLNLLDENDFLKILKDIKNVKI